jgi:glycosyltransferase 2 family protein
MSFSGSRRKTSATIQQTLACCEHCGQPSGCSPTWVSCPNHPISSTVPAGASGRVGTSSIGLAVLKWGISLLLITVTLALLDWPTLLTTLKSLSLWVTALVLLLCLLEYPLLGYRWHLISRADISIPLSEQLRYYFTAQLFGIFLPAKLGGDAFRFMALRSHAPGNARLLALIVQERMVGLVIYLMLFLLGALVFELTDLGSGLPSVAGAGVQLLELGFGAILGLLLVLPRSLGAAERMTRRFGLAISSATLEAIHQGCSVWSIRALLPVLFLSLIGAAGWCLMVLLIARDLGIDIQVPAILMICTMAELLRLIPLTVQGIGVREGTFAMAFVLVGQSAESGFAVGVVAYLLVTLADILIGFIGWFWSRYMASLIKSGAGDAVRQ